MPENSSPPIPSPPLPFSPPPGSGGKDRLAIIITALVVFLSGIIIGVGLTLLYLERRHPVDIESPEQTARLVVGKIDGSASLTPEERKLAEHLVEKHMTELSDIRRRYSEETRRKLGDMHQGLTEIIGLERMSRSGDLMRFHHEHPSGGNSPETGGGKHDHHGGGGGE